MANCLYNGIELPALPVWDKETYPYVCIDDNWYDENGNPIPEVYFLQEKPTLIYQPDNSLQWYIKLPYPFLMCERDNTTNEWGELRTINTSYNRSPYWGNFDIIAPDGTVLLAASDPIPVLSLTDSDLYRNVNGKLVKHTLYKKVGGELVALDDHIMA